MAKNKLLRMDNVGIVVESLDDTISDHRTAPVNALGYLRVMFTVEDIDEMVSRLIKHGAQLVGEVVQYENSYRLCYIRGNDGLLIGLAEQLGNK
ncbi:hypothetical protein RE628_14695 [Paenibacillus sp. D2_2]|uniref:hypothetical protein n=1 Tax=Paenibacillus sp. D2_2 TaxID=3073092 RepID=UPI0028163BB1|nr:hypothetical protein [Paenibacillus sp. D2_2]WMT38808.1 hypothetical protein RE628_14695 [Paenibacillus sp. D2_2]